MDYKHTALEMKDYVINTRRYLHEHPELSGKEENTVAFLDKELTGFGIEHVIVPEGGILCFIRGKGEKTVLLRADIDALPVDVYKRQSLAITTLMVDIAVCGVTRLLIHTTLLNMYLMQMTLADIFNHILIY